MKNLQWLWKCDKHKKFTLIDKDYKYHYDDVFLQHVCLVCFKDIKQDMYTHIDNSHNDACGLSFCNTCKEYYCSNDNKKHNYKQETDDNDHKDGHISCKSDKCQAIFNDRVKYVKHMTDVHTICKECLFKSATLLENFKFCVDCSTYYDEEQKHEEEHTINHKHCKDDKCRSIFNNRVNYEKHVMDIHKICKK